MVIIKNRIHIERLVSNNHHVIGKKDLQIPNAKSLRTELLTKVIKLNMSNILFYECAIVKSKYEAAILSCR